METPTFCDELRDDERVKEGPSERTFIWLPSKNQLPCDGTYIIMYTMCIQLCISKFNGIMVDIIYDGRYKIGFGRAIHYFLAIQSPPTSVTRKNGKRSSKIHLQAVN